MAESFVRSHCRNYSIWLLLENVPAKNEKNKWLFMQQQPPMWPVITDHFTNMWPVKDHPLTGHKLPPDWSFY